MSLKSIALFVSTVLAACSIPSVVESAGSSAGASAASAAGPYGYVTYHSYESSQSMSTVACSDGSNGMISKGYSDMSSLYPHVGAASFISWNSPQCGSCWTLTNPATGASVSITVLDACGSTGGYTAHFDIPPEAFQALGGAQGQADGHVVVSYSQC